MGLSTFCRRSPCPSNGLQALFVCLIGFFPNLKIGPFTTLEKVRELSPKQFYIDKSKLKITKRHIGRYMNGHDSKTEASQI